ncbi:MAG TPA: hybrid sensor histidine kinase/response regulator [Anaerolineae bacterium]|nr:hybrid sensor histidine kinase/response regulator [Anaerolineae bacterium]
MTTNKLALKILYIEDDANSRRLVQRVLEVEGYEVHVAENGLAGLEMARRLRPALVLTDVNMGGMTGHEVATRLKEMPETRHAPVIAITSNVLQTDRELALVAGCDGYITKPIDVDALPRLIERFLAGERESLPDNVRLLRLEEYSHTLVNRLESTVAELQTANDELHRMDKMKKDFVVLSSHELRTPTTLIYGYINLLKMETKDLPLGDRLMDMINRIASATQQLNDVVDAIINVSLIDSESLKFALVPIELSALVEVIVRELQPLAKQRDQQILTGDLANLPKVPADPNYLRRALTNLISNAIKYTPDGGIITLEAKQEHEAIHIVVSDTGIGIDHSELTRIFEKFYVLEDTKNHSSSHNAFMGGGLGLGLTVVRGIIEAHGGRIWVESEGEDPARMPGSRFHILLPLIAPKQ